MKFGVEEFKSVSRLIRLPNLAIIVLTQFLLRFCILQTYLYSTDPWAISPLLDFSLLVLVTVLIALGGYVINDYFDVKIDRVNKPDKVVIHHFISPRGAIKLHLLVNSIAILLGFYLSYRIRAISFGFIFPFIAGLLWVYSAKYKRSLIWGNLIVASLSAFVILIVWLFEFFWLRLDGSFFASVLGDIRWVTRVFVGYGMFAFLVSLFREVIKDMEDCRGDETQGCRTIPLVFGIKPAKGIVAVLVVFTMLLLAYAQVILYLMNWSMLFWYFTITVQLPSIYLLFRLFMARETADYRFLSSLCKIIMLAGILSMQLITIST